jgi:hypothetical protein
MASEPSAWREVGKRMSRARQPVIVIMRFVSAALFELRY